MNQIEYEFEHRTCPVCGSTDIQITSEAWWDGADASGQAIGGSVYLGICQPCRTELVKRTFPNGDTPWELGR